MSSHSKWAAWKRQMPPSTVPSMLTSSGSPSLGVLVSLAEGGRRLNANGPARACGVDHAQLVHQNFPCSAEPRAERGGVDHLEQGGDEELVGEHRKLADEVLQLLIGIASPFWRPPGVWSLFVIMQCCIGVAIDLVEEVRGIPRPAATSGVRHCGAVPRSARRRAASLLSRSVCASSG